MEEDLNAFAIVRALSIRSTMLSNGWQNFFSTPLLFFDFVFHQRILDEFYNMFRLQCNLSACCVLKRCQRVWNKKQCEFIKKGQYIPKTFEVHQGRDDWIHGGPQGLWSLCSVLNHVFKTNEFFPFSERENKNNKKKIRGGVGFEKSHA